MHNTDHKERLISWNVQDALKDILVAWIALPLGVLLASLLYAIVGSTNSSDDTQFAVSFVFLIIYCLAILYLRFTRKLTWRYISKVLIGIIVLLTLGIVFRWLFSVTGSEVITLLSAIYVVCVLLLTAFAIGSVALLITYLRHRNDFIATIPLTQYPTAAVQLPIYNEYYVVERLLKACAELDYPRDKLIIQVLDDSTDETSALVAELTQHWRDQGVDVRHIRRGTRDGYKAGALAYGLSLLDCEMTVVFDADFIPPPDFLKRAISHLVADPKLAVVKGRLVHLNSEENPLTRAVTLALDGHFAVEQTARSRAGWLMNFNGSAGVWRVQAIKDAGGWRDTTLAEDMDLSYRAQLKGWRLLYLPDLVVSGEIPPVINAYKLQQVRWAQDSLKALRHIGMRAWPAPNLAPIQRVLATLFLSQFVNPIMIIVILTIPLLLLSQDPDVVPFWSVGIIVLTPLLASVLIQSAEKLDWKQRITSIPLLLIVMIGTAANSTLAIMRSLANGWGRQRRAIREENVEYSATDTSAVDRSIGIELFLAIYSVWGLWLARTVSPTLVIYLGILALAFSFTALSSLRERLRSRDK